MSYLNVVATILVILTSVVVGCTPAPPREPGGSGTGAAPATQSGPKRIAVAVLREQDLRPTGTGPQRIVHPLIHQGLTGRATNRERAAR
jgi:hypothetical protein